MISAAVHFLAGRFTLLERRADAQVSLLRVWQDLFGSMPVFDEGGDSVRGFHLPGRRDEERSIFLLRPSHPVAIMRASWLIGAKWQLTGIHVNARPRIIPRGWAPGLEGRPELRLHSADRAVRIPRRS